jgi:hypothetical protein
LAQYALQTDFTLKDSSGIPSHCPGLRPCLYSGTSVAFPKPTPTGLLLVRVFFFFIRAMGNYPTDRHNGSGSVVEMVGNFYIAQETKVLPGALMLLLDDE